MKLETFSEKFEQFADARDAVTKMRELLLPLAVTGQRVPLEPLNNFDAEILPSAVAKLGFQPEKPLPVSVVDLKKGEFKPEYAGKMNFYCSAVDDLLRHAHDAPTIGLILCQTKDRLFAEYALRDIHKPIGLAEYELTRALPQELASSLPSIAELEAELGQEAAE